MYHFELVFSFLLEVYPRVELLDHVVILFWFLKEPCMFRTLKMAVLLFSVHPLPAQCRLHPVPYAHN